MRISSCSWRTQRHGAGLLLARSVLERKIDWIHVVRGNPWLNSWPRGKRRVELSPHSLRPDINGILHLIFTEEESLRQRLSRPCWQTMLKDMLQIVVDATIYQFLGTIQRNRRRLSIRPIRRFWADLQLDLERLEVING